MRLLITPHNLGTAFTCRSVEDDDIIGYGSTAEAALANHQLALEQVRMIMSTAKDARVRRHVKVFKNNKSKL